MTYKQDKKETMTTKSLSRLDLGENCVCVLQLFFVSLSLSLSFTNTATADALKSVNLLHSSPSISIATTLCHFPLLLVCD